MRYQKYLPLLFITLILGIACKPRTPQPMKTYTLLGLGDSYTFGQNVDTSQRYLTQLYTQLLAQKHFVAYPKIIAQTGWTTRNLLDNIALESLNKKYDFVFLLIGVNNEYQQQAPEEVYRAEFISCLESALSSASGKAGNVFVVSIPDYSVTRSQGRKPVPNATSIRLDAFNKIKALQE